MLKRTGEEADYVASFVTEIRFQASWTAVRESDILALSLNIRSVMIVLK